MESLRETPETIVTLPSDDAIATITLLDPSSSSPSNHAKDRNPRFALLSPPSEYDLRSLPPTPQDSSPVSIHPFSQTPAGLNTNKPHPPTPLTISPRTPHSPSGVFPFPTHQRRKPSSASQQSGAFARSSVASTLSYSSSTGGAPSTSSMPPSLPTRSPLRRPAAKSTASFTGVLKEFDLAPNSPLPLFPDSSSYAIYSNSGSSDSNLLSFSRDGSNRPPDRALPRRPSDASDGSGGSLNGQAFINPNPSLTSFAPTITASSPLASASTPNLGTSSPRSSTSKRQHALLELLSSERTYAADLAVVRDIHIPLSRGQPPPFEAPSAAHMLSSLSSSPRSSTHTTSTASSAQTTSTAASSLLTPPISELPMTPEASRIIFGNIDEIAIFADRFAERLESALGNVLKHSGEDDRVGELFLEVIPVMAPLYKTYITRHPTALAQFQSLPPSPALTAYMNTTRTLTASHTHAWDIPSLLIKPVQRLLKYPLLLSTIYSDTPDTHPDKATLLEAKESVEEVARMVNEGRRRWEVVKTVLGQTQAKKEASNPSTPPVGGPKGSPAPKMSRMRSFRSKIKAGIVDVGDLNQGKEELERWEKRIKECEMVTKDVARHALEWNQDVHTSLKKLKAWNTGFGDVVGLGEQGVEAVGAFGKVVSGLLTLWKELDRMINIDLLKQLSTLLKTLSSPRILLTHMHTLRHSHITLLNTPYNKSRPPSALIEASNDYLALQATLREELPAYIALFEKGLGVILLEFSKWQKGYWRELRDRWVSFWVALAAEGDGDEAGAIAGIGTGARETIKIWWERFGELEEIINGFEITTRRGASRHLRALDEAPGSFYRQSNGSATSFQERSSQGVYQSSPQSLSAQDLLSAAMYDLGLQEEGEAVYPSPPFRGRHRRNGSKESNLSPKLPPPPLQPQRSAASTSDLAHMMTTSSMPGPAFMTSSMWPKRDKSKGREKEGKSSKPSKKESYLPKNPKSPTEPMRVPRMVEPFAQNLGVGRTFAPSTSPGYGERNYWSKETKKQPERDTTTSGSSNGGTRVFKRRLTDALFGIPRTSASKHGRSKSLSSELGMHPESLAPPTSIKAKPSSDQLSGSSSNQSQRSSFAPIPSQPPSSESLPPSSPFPSQLDPPSSPLYACTTVVPFIPPPKTAYMSLPFLTLHVGDTIQVLYEAGHPAEHALPIFIDEGEDCLLVARDEAGRVGWAFASFLLPLA